MLKLLNEIRVLMTRRDKIKMLCILGLMVVGAGLEILGITILMPVVAVLANPELLEQNRYLKIIRDFVAPAAPSHFMLVMCVCVMCFYIGKNLFLLAMTYWQSKFIYDRGMEWGKRLFDNYLRVDYQFHLKHNTAELLNNLNQLYTVVNGVLLSAMMLLTEAVVVAAILALLMIFAPVTTLVAAAVSAGLAALLYRPLRHYSYRLGRRWQESTRAINQCSMQAFGGIKEVKIRNREDYFSREHAKAQYERNHSEMLLYFSGQFPRLAMEAMVVTLAMAVLIVFVAAGMATGTIVLTAALLAMAMYRLLPSVSRMYYNLVRMRQSLCSFDTVYHDLTGLPVEDKHATGEAIEFKDTLRVEQVTFSYDSGVYPVLKDFSAAIPCRASVAFVGPTGCGKTTLADVILGLLTPQQGRVAVDGRPIRENLASWQRKIGYVPQFIYLLDDTIAANIAFGVAPEEVDHERIAECLAMVRLDEFIRTLPGGTATVIGEGGARLSGGQRQRIGIARALYHRPELLMLDEATSALDTDTEKAVIDALNTLQGTLTIIMIAHRLSTIEQCDRVIRLG